MVISGPLTIDTVAALANCDERQLSGNQWTVDLGRVGAVDSAAVSLLLVWLRRAQRNNANLVLLNVPDNLVSLANLYGVAESLNIKCKN
jgi:phospholipid transport system transporter-binding protein